MKNLETIAIALQDLKTKYSRLNWAKYTTGLDFGVNDAYGHVVELLKNNHHWNTIQSCKESETDPVNIRKTLVMERAFKPFHLSENLNNLSMEIQQLTSKLSAVLNTHRCKVNGIEMSSPDIARILSTSQNRELREKAYLSREQISKPLIDIGFLDLVSLRREYAREMGASDFVQYSLEDQELEPDMFSSWQEELHKILPLMKKVRSEFAEEYIKADEVMPWDEAFIASSIAPELNSVMDMSGFLMPIDELFKKFGFDITSMNITYDVFSRKNKSEWGYNFPIQTGIDSRILANVKDRFSGFGVLLHETGHAVHSFTSDPREIILNKGISGIVSEGIANLFGSFRGRKIFYSQFFGSSTEEAEKHFNELKRWTRASQLMALGRIFFDQNIYRTDLNDLDDINQLFWDNRKNLFGEEPYADQPVWANTIHYTTHPIYPHNYLLGDLTCDMLEEVFLHRESITDIMENPIAFGDFVKNEVIKPSGMYPFPDLFKRISGEDLSLSFLTGKIRETIS